MPRMKVENRKNRMQKEDSHGERKAHRIGAKKRIKLSKQIR
jgi:hypothetical protein